jgi:uncharacterized protein (TIGR03067 family)
MVHSFVAALFLFVLATCLTNAQEGKPGSLDGTWIPESAVLGGSPFSEEIRKTIKLELKGDNYVATVGGTIDKGTIKLKPGTDPKQMDITGIEGPTKGKTVPAIYEHDGDTLRVCYDLSCKEYPTEFKSKEGTLLYLVVYKREKK